MNPDISKLKAALEAERQTLEHELKAIGRVNPRNPQDWELKPMGDQALEPEFRDDTIDNLEEMDEREEIEISLEQRHRNINRALEKIAAGTYGVCEICQQPIEPDRLEANPAARSCKQHREEGDRLPQ